MTEFVIQVTGARDWRATRDGRSAVYRSLRDAAVRLDPAGAERVRGDWPHDQRAGYWPNIAVRHGGARGLDLVAHAVAPMLGMVPQRMDADWPGPCDELCDPGHRRPRRGGSGTYCPRAGHRRNRDMILAEPMPDETLGYPLTPFPHGGTWDCMMHSAEFDIPTWHVAPDGASRLWDNAELLRGRAIREAHRRRQGVE